MSCRLLIQSFLGLSLILVTVEASKTIDPWTKIDRHIYSKTIHKGRGFADPHKSLQAAQDWLVKLKSTTCTLFKKPDENVVASLEKLVNLKKSIDQKECTRKNRKILDELIALAETRNYNFRLENLVLVLLVPEFAEQCQREHPKRYFDRIESVDQEQLGRIRLFFMEMIHSKIDPKGRAYALSNQNFYVKWGELYSNRRYLYRYFILDANQIELKLDTDNDAGIAYDSIEHIVSHDPSFASLKEITPTVDGKLVFTAKKAEELFMNLIHGSCRDYVMQFGSDVFGMAQADVVALSRRNISVLPDVSLSQYYLDWAMHKGCLALIKDVTRLDTLLTKLGRVAEENARHMSRAMKP